jgi:hypothetical protein
VNGTAALYQQAAGAHSWHTAASGNANDAITFTQAMTLDASGNLGVGSTSPDIWSFGGTGRYLTHQATNAGGFALVQIVSEGTTGGGVGFGNATIRRATIEGANGSNLVFATNGSNSGTSVTERARITSGGYFKASDDAVYVGATDPYHEFKNTANDVVTYAWASNASYTSTVLYPFTSRSASDAFNLMQMGSSAGSDVEFKFRGDGNAYADGTFNNNGADYAEYFESATGAALPVGATVVLDGNKVREATEGDAPSAILGVVRPKAPGKASMVIGNTAWNKWSNKYLTDDFDCYVMEAHEVVEWTDEDSKFHSYESNRIPADVVVPEDAVRKTHDEKGNPFEHYKLNPAYDPSVEYVPREKRDEWVIVGLVGQVKMLAGQPVNDRWVKMRDVSAAVEEWMIR